MRAWWTQCNDGQRDRLGGAVGCSVMTVREAGLKTRRAQYRGKLEHAVGACIVDQGGMFEGAASVCNVGQEGWLEGTAGAVQRQA